MPKNARRWIVIEVVTPSPPIYRQLLSSRNPSDPYNNRELRDDNAETSVFWRKLKISPDVRWCQREFPSINIISFTLLHTRNLTWESRPLQRSGDFCYSCSCFLNSKAPLHFKILTLAETCHADLFHLLTLTVIWHTIPIYLHWQ